MSRTRKHIAKAIKVNIDQVGKELQFQADLRKEAYNEIILPEVLRLFNNGMKWKAAKKKAEDEFKWKCKYSKI